MKVAVRHNGLDNTYHSNPMARLSSPYRLERCDYYLFIVASDAPGEAGRSDSLRRLSLLRENKYFLNYKVDI